MHLESSDDKLIISKAEDTLRIAEKRCGIKTFGFLNPHQRLVLKKHIFPNMDMRVLFDGGYEEAERTLLVCFPDFLQPAREDYLDLLECTGRDTERLSHRDYLGSLMGLGIVRENIGDILVSGERTLFFVKPESTEYILQNLTKIGSCGVHIRKCEITDTEIPERRTKDFEGTVAALRLDCVIALAAGISRAKSAELIRSGMTTVNWEPEEDVSAVLKEGDIFSVRGFGRMKLSGVGAKTRKGRLSITISRYV